MNSSCSRCASILACRSASFPFFYATCTFINYRLPSSGTEPHVNHGSHFLNLFLCKPCIYDFLCNDLIPNWSPKLTPDLRARCSCTCFSPVRDCQLSCNLSNVFRRSYCRLIPSTALFTSAIPARVSAIIRLSR
ncbi:MAG: hypothetical protein CM15mV47_610 [uncultured marine virus]|nr:MAG: hypothetical protein CM15mV47_610 [uncultured marine virus]